MLLTEMKFQGQPPIDAYGPGFFRVQNVIHQGGLLLSVGGAFQWSGFDDLTLILAQKTTFDILFIGNGSDIAPLPAAVRSIFEESGIGAEVMSSPSACRTYNILLSEGRRVALAAFPV
jgi:uncharacterized protein